MWAAGPAFIDSFNSFAAVHTVMRVGRAGFLLRAERLGGLSTDFTGRPAAGDKTLNACQQEAGSPWVGPAIPVLPMPYLFPIPLFKIFKGEGSEGGALSLRALAL